MLCCVQGGALEHTMTTAVDPKLSWELKLQAFKESSSIHFRSGETFGGARVAAGQALCGATPACAERRELSCVEGQLGWTAFHTLYAPETLYVFS